MTPIQQITYDIVRNLQQQKNDAHRFPAVASLLDIQKAVNGEVKKALNGFIEDKTMVWFKNVNGIPMFQIQSLNNNA